MYKVVSWLLEKVFAMTSVLSVCSLDKTLLAFALLHFVLKGQTCLLFQISLDLLFLHSNPHDEKDILVWC